MLGGRCGCLAAPPGLLRMLPILGVLIRNLEFYKKTCNIKSQKICLFSVVCKMYIASYVQAKIQDGGGGGSGGGVHTPTSSLHDNLEQSTTLIKLKCHTL